MIVPRRVPVSDGPRQGSAILASRIRARFAADVQLPPESHKLGAPGATPGSAPSFPGPAPVALPVPVASFRCERCHVAITFPAERQAA